MYVLSKKVYKHFLQIKKNSKNYQITETTQLRIQAKKILGNKRLSTLIKPIKNKNKVRIYLQKLRIFLKIRNLFYFLLNIAGPSQSTHCGKQSFSSSLFSSTYSPQ